MVTRGLDTLRSSLWECAGNVPIESRGIRWNTPGEDHASIFDHPVRSVRLYSFIHLAEPDDEWVVAAGVAAAIASVLAFAGDEGRSFADGHGEEFRQVAVGLASATIVDGSTLVTAIAPWHSGQSNRAYSWMDRMGQPPRWRHQDVATRTADSPRGMRSEGRRRAGATSTHEPG